MNALATLFAAAFLLLSPVAARAADAPAPGTAAASAGDYPEATRREYVAACSSVNGGAAGAEKSCSCSIDVIASILPFDRYEQAETVLRMRQLGGGYLAQEFRVQATNDIVRALREAQAEAEVRCF